MKKFMTLFLAVAIVFGLAGCQKKDDRTTITYAIWDSNQAKQLEKLVAEFEETNPEIKIDIHLTGWDDFWTMLEAAGTGDSMPDTFWMHTNEFYKYASNDKMLELDDFISKSELIDMKNYPEDLGEIFNLNGNQYAIPKDFDTVGLWYNKKMFDDANMAYPDESWDWDDLLKAAEKLTIPEKNQYGYYVGLTNQEGYYNFIFQNDGEVLTEDNKSGYDSPATIEALDFYVDFYRKGFSPEFTEDILQTFTSQLVAMAPLGSWQVGNFLDNEEMLEVADVTVLPKGPNGTRSSIFNGLGNAISKNTKHPEESWKWIEFLESEHGQKRQAELGYAIPAFEGTADAWIEATNKFNTKVFIDMLEYGQIRPYSQQTARWEDKANEILTQVFTQEKTIEEATSEIAKIMNSYLEEESK